MNVPEEQQGRKIGNVLRGSLLPSGMVSDEPYLFGQIALDQVSRGNRGF